MKASELIEKLKGFEDFDLMVVVNISANGERPRFIEGDLTFEDIGYSSNKIVLGVDTP